MGPRECLAGPKDEDRPRSNLDCEDTMDTVMPDSMCQGAMDCEGHTASTDDIKDEEDDNDDLHTPRHGNCVGS